MIKNLTDRIFIGNIIEVGEEVEACPEDFPPTECSGGNSFGSALGDMGVGDIQDLGAASQITSVDNIA
jgi:hypothetical protein